MRKWKYLEGSEPAKCEVCGNMCIPKNVGTLCYHCIDAGIPQHIPVVQYIKYLKARGCNLKDM